MLQCARSSPSQINASIMPSDALLTKSMMEMDLGRKAVALDVRGRKSKKHLLDDRGHRHQDRLTHAGRHERNPSCDSGTGETRSTSRMTNASTAYDYCETSPSRSTHVYSYSHPASAGMSGVPRHIVGGGRRSAAADDGYRDPPPLSWRLDPDESLSDWLLTVTSTDSVPCIPRRRNDAASASAGCSSDANNDEADDQLDDLADSMSPHAKKYHVHRAQLAVGPRRSDYFATLFKNRRRMMRDKSDQELEKGSDKSTDGTYIELKASAAAAFPIMLDFMYSPIGTPVEATTESAVALRHLASCFGIRELFNSITDFIKRDLRPETAPTYLVEAATYKHDKLTAASLKICAESFMNIKLSVIVLLPPDLFELVVRSPHLVCNSESLSARVAAYCRCRPDGVDLEKIKSLTDAQIMPRVAPDEALFYIHLLSLLGVDLPDSSKGGAAPTLYDRCVVAAPNVVRGALQVKHSPLCTHTSSFHDRQRQTINRDYDDLPSGVKVDLLESTIADTVHAADNCPIHGEEQSDDEETSLVKSPSSDELRDELSAAKEGMMDLQGEIKRLKRKMERAIEKYETKLNAREDEVQKCKEELLRFVRVPNDYESPSACTYQEDVEYDKYGEPMYGQIPPTAMPRWGHADSRDGLIYREEERFDTRYWPMFYYKGDKR
jgi:hypothetical protein